MAIPTDFVNLTDLPESEYLDNLAIAVESSDPAQPTKHMQLFEVTKKIRTDSASQIGGVYEKDYSTVDTIPADAMTNKLMYWHNGQFYSVGTDTGFTSNDFEADLAAGRFVSAISETQIQKWKNEGDIRGWNYKIGEDIAVYINLALADIKGSYEQSKPLKFPSGIHKWVQQVNVTVEHGSQNWTCNGVCTFDVRSLASIHPLIVDYSKNGTANFLSFNTKNIQWSDLSLDYSRRGPHFKRVIGSKWINPHFNYFAIPLAMDENSNLNTIINAQFRGNRGRIVGYIGGAMNNVFINAQFRYNEATMFKALGDQDFAGNFLETTFIGGDIEPYNASPCFDISSTNIEGMRCERNNASVQFKVGDDCNLRNLQFHSDGATQAIGVDVTGRGNSIHIKYFSGQRAINFQNSSRDNNYEIVKSVIMNAGGNILVNDLGDRNMAIVNGIAQTDGLYSYPMKKGYLLPRDLSLWTAVGGTITRNEETDSWLFVANGTESQAYIYAQIVQTDVKDLIVGLTVDPSSPSGQVAVFTNVNPIFDGNEIGIGGYNDSELPPVRIYAQRNNYLGGATPLNNPYVMIKTAAPANGAAVLLKDIVASAIAYPPSM